MIEQILNREVMEQMFAVRKTLGAPEIEDKRCRKGSALSSRVRLIAHCIPEVLEAKLARSKTVAAEPIVASDCGGGTLTAIDDCEFFPIFPVTRLLCVTSTN